MITKENYSIEVLGENGLWSSIMDYKDFDDVKMKHKNLSEVDYPGTSFRVIMEKITMTKEVVLGDQHEIQN